MKIHDTTKLSIAHMKVSHDDVRVTPETCMLLKLRNSTVDNGLGAAEASS